MQIYHQFCQNFQHVIVHLDISSAILLLTTQKNTFIKSVHCSPVLPAWLIAFKWKSLMSIIRDSYKPTSHTPWKPSQQHTQLHLQTCTLTHCSFLGFLLFIVKVDLKKTSVHNNWISFGTDLLKTNPVDSSNTLGINWLIRRLECWLSNLTLALILEQNSLLSVIPRLF